VALVALTVKVDELPALIDAGLAPMLTVGAGDLEEPAAMELPPPQPLKSRGNMRPEAIEEEIQLIDLRMRANLNMSILPLFHASLTDAAVRGLISELIVGVGLD
jgi:hypothetical protein